MPGYERPGRGRAAQWTKSSVLRAIYVSRLRRLGVSGRLIPMLAFLRDGWGWRYIRDDVADAVRKGAAIDRRSMIRRACSTMSDLIDNVEQRSDLHTPNSRPYVEFRKYLATAIWSGSPAAGTSGLAGLSLLADELVALHLISEEEARDIGPLAADLERARTEHGISTSEFAEVLLTLDDDEAARGRNMTLAWLNWMRKVLRRLAHGTAQSEVRTNPIAFFGHERETAVFLRQQPGRPTPADMLAATIAQGLFDVSVLRREVPRT